MIKLNAPKFWETKSPVAILLLPLSFIYYLLYKIDIFFKLKKPFHPGVPVISVGNLTVGGSGKTPVVAMLARHFKAKGEKVAILSRGYGGSIKKAQRVRTTDTAAFVGDEPKMLRKMLPGVEIWVGKNRCESAKKAVKNGATIIILDDGFQHRKLARDIDIVVMDGKYGIGNGFLFPAGPLREPLTALKRANFIIGINGKPNINSNIITTVANITFKGSNIAPMLSRKVVAFCGIGNPSKFFNSLASEGVNVVRTCQFPDHHPYTMNDMQELMRITAKEQAMLVTTAKDATRLGVDFIKRCHVVHIDFTPESMEGIVALLDMLLPKKTSGIV